MSPNALRRVLVCLLCAAVLGMAPKARAAETVSVGVVSGVLTIYWPLYIAHQKGMFAAEGITLDIVNASSSSASMLQLAAGSLDIASSSTIDPIRAIEKGASMAIIRIEGEAPPFSLMAKPTIAKIEDLKGKIISVGGLTDITRIYVERMLAPHGIKRGEFDMVYAGQSGARFAALQSGAADAAILAAPVDAVAAAAGFRNLGLTLDYVKDLPFTAYSAGRAWATEHKPAVQKFLAGYQMGTDWFYDDRNRDEAIAIMVGLAQGPAENVAKSYDFFRKIQFFERTGKVSKENLVTLTAVLKDLGVLETSVDPAALVLP